MRMATFVTTACLLLGGCNLDDPNVNEHIRYQMAMAHAKATIERGGSSLSPDRPDYNLEIFFRRHFDEKANIRHSYEIYDFLKNSHSPGPERIIIAYDNVTRMTHLRSNLRSNVNLDSCARFRRPQPTSPLHATGQSK